MGLSNIWDKDKGTVIGRETTKGRGIGYIGTGTKVKNEKTGTERQGLILTCTSVVLLNKMSLSSLPFIKDTTVTIFCVCNEQNNDDYDYK